MTRIARAAWPDVVQALRSRAFTRDSVGLSVPDRQRNVANRVRLVRPVVTSGWTSMDEDRRHGTGVPD